MRCSPLFHHMCFVNFWSLIYTLTLSAVQLRFSVLAGDKAGQKTTDSDLLGRASVFAAYFLSGQPVHAARKPLHSYSQGLSRTLILGNSSNEQVLGGMCGSTWFDLQRAVELSNSGTALTIELCEKLIVHSEVGYHGPEHHSSVSAGSLHHGAESARESRAAPFQFFPRHHHDPSSRTVSDPFRRGFSEEENLLCDFLDLNIDMKAYFNIDFIHLSCLFSCFYF